MHILEDAVGHVTEDHLAALETENAALRRAFQTGDIGRAAQVDSAFHRIMQQASGNVTVVGLLQGLDKKVLDRNYRTVTMALVAFQGNAESYTAPDFGALMAAYVLASVPLLMLFSFLMRSYIEGLSSGSLKG